MVGNSCQYIKIIQDFYLEIIFLLFGTLPRGFRFNFQSLQTVQKGLLLACEIECQHNIFTVNGLSLKIVQESFVRNNLSTEKVFK